MKQKPLKEFLNASTTSQRLDHLMKEILQNKFDSELKNRYEESLKTNYDVYRDRPSQASSNKLWKAIAAVAILATMVLSYVVLQQMEPENDKTKVQQYLAENVMLYHGVSRSAELPNNKAREMAYEAFNNGNYEAFINRIQTSSPLTTEDKFFQAYAKMITENYTTAVAEFKTINASLVAGQDYYDESNLYYAICLQLTNPEEYSKLYETLKDKSWVKQQLDKLTK